MFFARTAPGVLLLALWITTSHADEGMWTFNNFPADKVQKAYGFQPDQAWLDHVRLSSVRPGALSHCPSRLPQRPTARAVLILTGRGDRWCNSSDHRLIVASFIGC